MERRSVELTQQEATALLQLIDAAVKAVGMQGAEAAVVLTRKIQEAFKPVQEVEKPAEQ